MPSEITGMTELDVGEIAAVLATLIGRKPGEVQAWMIAVRLRHDDCAAHEEGATCEMGDLVQLSSESCGCAEDVAGELRLAARIVETLAGRVKP